jgi:Carboxypeptidase regulatory-like domain
MISGTRVAHALVLTVLSCLSGSRSLAAQKPSPLREKLSSTNRVAGVAVSKIDGHPLAHARITLQNAADSKEVQSLVTSEDGKFEFNVPRAGKYSLEGAKRGFISAGYDQHDQYSTAIVTGARLDTENLVLKLAPQAVITGNVLDESGEPVRNAAVTAYYDDHSQGIGRIQSVRSVRTDDRGIYEIASLGPGTYFLSVSARPWYAVHPIDLPASHEKGDTATSAADRSLDVAYLLVYYPDVTQADDAQPIPVRGGERMELDFHLNPVPALHLIFHVPGDNEHGFTSPRIEQPSFDGSSFVEVNLVRMISSGVMEVTGVPAGRYNIRLQGPDQQTQLKDVDLSKDGEQIDTTAAEPFSSVKISVQMEGGSALPPTLSVFLRQKSKVIAVGKVDAKGQVELAQVPAGRYEIFVLGRGSRYSVTRLSVDGTASSGDALNVSPGVSPSVTVSVVSGSAQVEGVVQKSGKPFAGAMVVLVPRGADANRDLFRRDQSDLDGTFSLPYVIPGSYTLLAIENGWDLDWSRPEVIGAYSKFGRPIEVTGESHHLKVPEPIEACSK